MSGGDMIVIRLELERMKYAIQAALTEHEAELSVEVDRQLQNIVDNFDWEAAVKSVSYQVIDEAVKEAVKAYFNYGEGEKYIRKVVSETLSKIKARK